MKKTLLAAALASASFATLAQSSVTLYGTLDVGVASVSHAGAVVQNGNTCVCSKTPMVGSLATPSNFGLTGTEEIAPDLKGIFNVEAGFNPANGSLDGAQFSGSNESTKSTFFDRNAFVGLESGKAGTVRLGRIHTTAHDFGATADSVANAGGIDSSYYIIGGGPVSPGTTPKVNGGTGTNMNIWTDNTVRYDSLEYYGVSFSGNYSLGGQAQGRASGQSDGYGLKFKNSIVEVTGAIQQDTAADALNRFTTRELGGKFNVGSNFSFTALFQQNKVQHQGQAFDITVDGGAPVAVNLADSNVEGIGALYTWDQLTFAGQAYNVKWKNFNDGQGSVSNAHSRVYTLFADYHLSKRTSVYADFITVHNKNAGDGIVSNALSATTGTNLGTGIASGAAITANNESQRLIGLGVTHQF